DEDGGHVAFLGQPDEVGGDLADLGDAAGDAGGLGGADGLHRVDHEHAGLDFLHVGDQGGQLGLGGEVEVVADGVDAVGAEPDLGGRLLAGDVENGLALGDAGGGLQQQRGLADAGLAGQQHDRAWHQAAAEDPVELADAGAAGGGDLRLDLADRHRRSGGGTGLDDADAGAAALFVDGAPRLALAAAAHPLGGAPAALGTAVSGLLGSLGHAEQASGRDR